MAMVMLPETASAQLRPCGPGETPIGMDNSNPSIPVPLCPGQSAEQPSAADSYAGMAFHPDAADVWVIGGYRGPGTAVQMAIAECNKVMGSGCQSNGDWWNTHLEVIRNAYGELLFIWGANGKKARKELMANCKKDQELPCESVKKFQAHTRRHLPGIEVRKSYAAAFSTWSSGSEPDRQSNLYVASGQPTLEEAKKVAGDACRRANPGRKCDMRNSSGNGFLQTFRSNGNLYVTAEITVARAQLAAKNRCDTLKTKGCVLDTVYDARKPGVFIHNFSN
jgi:hypothetical protein